MKLNSEKLLQIVFVLFVFNLYSCGVKGPSPIPSTYYETEPELSVDIVKIAPKPVMRDSGQGGLIGLLVNSGRSSNMKEQLEGIKGETVKELLRQNISDKMEEVFDIADVEDNPGLALDVNITTWGWFVPSTAFGIKTGSYQFEIIGFASVFDQMQPERKEIAYITAFSQKPLGNDPDKEETQQALLQAIDDFSTQVANMLLSSSE